MPLGTGTIHLYHRDNSNKSPSYFSHDVPGTSVGIHSGSSILWYRYPHRKHHFQCTCIRKRREEKKKRNQHSAFCFYCWVTTKYIIVYSTTHALPFVSSTTFINPRPSLRHTSKIQCGPIAFFCGTAVSGIQNLHRSKKHCYPPTSTCEVSASIQTIRLAHIAIDCCLNLKVVRLMPP